MITVFGSINLDQVGTVTRLPRPGETVAGGTFSMAAGGKGANQALAARRAGASVRMIGAVGDDGFAEPALAILDAAGVDLEGVSHVANTATGIAMILVDSAGENVIAALPGANGTLTPEDAERALDTMREGDILLLQQEIPQAATARALTLARERGVVSVFNTAPFLDTTPDIADLASVLVANETEFDLLAGTDASTRESAMRARAAEHGQAVIITLGAEGAWAATSGDVIKVPAKPVKPVDTVGAGDTFCGYLAAGLDHGRPLEAVMRRASVAASLACLKPGAQPAIPLAAEVADAL